MFANASGAGAGLAILLFAVISIGIYFIPTIVASTRKVTNVGSVFVINLLLGWTLVGWAVALAMAVKTNMTQVHVVTSSTDPATRHATTTTRSNQPQAPIAIRTTEPHVPASESAKGVPTVWCDACNKELRAGVKFCPQCGSQTLEVNLDECMDCGSPIALDDKFCPSCGTSVA